MRDRREDDKGGMLQCRTDRRVKSVRAINGGSKYDSTGTDCTAEAEEILVDRAHAQCQYSSLPWQLTRRGAKLRLPADPA